MQYGFVVWLSCMAWCAVAQTPVERPRQMQTDSLFTELHFRWDNAVLDTLYLGNDRALSLIRQRIDSIGIEHIDSVGIISQSSPEGPYYHNQRLSQRRARAMRAYMEEHYPALGDRLTVNHEGESWEQLRKYVQRDEELSAASIERVLGIIDDNTVPIATKKRRLTNDPVYRYLYKTYYPRIRNSMVCIVHSHPIALREPIALPAPGVATSWVIEPTRLHKVQNLPPLPVPPPERDTLTIGLKTNLLYDLATALNFEVEVPIGNHWSVAVEDVFPWWETGNKYCLQLWEMGVEGRYWFRENHYHAHKFRGHFLGLYGMSGKYDFQRDYDACYQGEFWSAGVTYGYVMSLSRRFRLEFSLSVGWLSTAYRHYFPADDYSELWRDHYDHGRKNWFGPTKLKVALVWPLHLSYTKKKGGRR